MSRRLRVVVASTSLLALSGALSAGGCTQETVTVPVRSLARSGRVSFVCLGPAGQGSAAVPLDRCDRHTTDGPEVFATDATGAPLPHLYALVTQTTRGEVAVVDVTAATNSVLDLDALVPGANFLPTAAQPVDIVSTPGGTATFVATAEVGRQGLFALPSSQIRPCDDCAPPRLTSWPACSLPSAPGEMVLVDDPASDGLTRASCDGVYGEAAVPGDREVPGSNGDLSDEGSARQKLLVTLPELGGFVVVDAQRLLDREVGSFDPCPIERWVPLSVDLPPPSQPPPPGATSSACVDPETVAPGAVTTYSARPAGLALSEGRLFIADLDAPVIHTIDLPTPCEPVELPPLLPTSVDDPTRVVTTSRIAVSPLATPELRRFLYAIDAPHGTTMVFDVTDGAASPYPLRRKNPEWDPFEPPDRVRFGAPAHDIVILQRDVAQQDPSTGIAVTGTRCSPDSTKLECSTTSTTCDIETAYQTSDTFDSGAGPRSLRGVFAFILLTSGRVQVIDIDDYDADCRGPKTLDPLLGCAASDADVGDASGEASCNVVLPHQARSAYYITTADSVGRREAGLSSFPVLSRADGSLIPADDPDSPRLRAVVPSPARTQSLVVGADPLPIDTTGLITDDPTRHVIVMNQEDPRAHLVDQAWAITYEGALPGFSGRAADLRLSLDGATESGLYDPDSRFCGVGVQSQASVRGILEAQGTPVDQLDALSESLADHLVIESPLASQDDAQWDKPDLACSYQICKIEFGSSSLPTRSRDLTIVEAYEDHLVLAASTAGVGREDELPSVGNELVECCFPTLISFNVRPSNQWVAVGEASGFLHHVIADPATGACRNSCDPSDQRRNGRVREAARGAVITEGDPFAFINPMFRFGIDRGNCPGDIGCAKQCAGAECEVPSTRGDQFRIVTQGAFASLGIDLRVDTNDVQPQSISFVSPTGEIAVTDGSLEGLMLISTSSVSLNRQFF